MPRRHFFRSTWETYEITQHGLMCAYVLLSLSLFSHCISQFLLRSALERNGEKNLISSCDASLPLCCCCLLMCALLSFFIYFFERQFFRMVLMIGVLDSVYQFFSSFSSFLLSLLSSLGCTAMALFVMKIYVSAKLFWVFFSRSALFHFVQWGWREALKARDMPLIIKWRNFQIQT